MTAQSASEVSPTLVRLAASDIPLNAPLGTPLLGPDGALLFEADVVIPDETTRDFLFRHFEPHRAAGRPRPRNRPRMPAAKRR